MKRKQRKKFFLIRLVKILRKINYLTLRQDGRYILKMLSSDFQWMKVALIRLMYRLRA